MFMERSHRESVEIFSHLTNDALNSKCTTPDGASIAVWKWLRAMVEHEIHHRGQIYIYLAIFRGPHSAALWAYFRRSAAAES